MRSNNKYILFAGTICININFFSAYVAVEEGTKSVSLSIALKERSSAQALVMPEWKIKIRQLECPKIASFLDKFKNYQAAKDFPLLGRRTLKNAIMLTPYLKVKSFIYSSTLCCSILH